MKYAILLVALVIIFNQDVLHEVKSIIVDDTFLAEGAFYEDSTIAVISFAVRDIYDIIQDSVSTIFNNSTVGRRYNSTVCMLFHGDFVGHNSGLTEDGRYVDLVLSLREALTDKGNTGCYDD